MINFNAIYVIIKKDIQFPVADHVFMNHRVQEASVRLS